MRSLAPGGLTAHVLRRMLGRQGLCRVQNAVTSKKRKVRPVLFMKVRGTKVRQHDDDLCPCA